MNDVNSFIRATHENGKYRNLPKWKDDFNVDYLHTLEIEPMTLDDIIEYIHKYNEQFPDTPYINDKAEICQSLVDMLMYDMVRVVNVN